MPCFLQVHVMPLRLYGRPTLVPTFTNQKIHKEDFCFYEKRQKAKIRFSICFAMRLIKAAHTPISKRGPSSSFPRDTLSASVSSHQSFELSPWTSVLYLDLFCTFINEMCPEVSEKPMRGYFLGLGMFKNVPCTLLVTAFSFYTIWA